MKALYQFLPLLLWILLSGCGREQQIPIPYVYVNYTVYLNNPSNDQLRVPGGYLILPDQGNHGIILYRRSIGDDFDFIAMDLTCTHEPTDSCKLFIDDTDFYLECPCCGSKFTIFDGLVAQGPARWPLKQYQTSFNGNTVRIYN
ncbi:MAG: Rieske (2Fe-2S) protein [Bacteroidales bacterium]|nr:Rieske (2Fe-2S) protein [Bacteroidales bacterium]